MATIFELDAERAIRSPQFNLDVAAINACDDLRDLLLDNPTSPDVGRAYEALVAAIEARTKVSR